MLMCVKLSHRGRKCIHMALELDFQVRFDGPVLQGITAVAAAQ